MRQWHRIHNKKGQATAELAIMGSILIMLLAYLVQQGYIYNSRQAMEMYTFRKALQLSKEGVDRVDNRHLPVGITLTVMRDVISPSFFSSINRQRLMSSASVDLNPWIIYQPDVPEDTPTKQLLQMGEAMIRNRLFFEVPPTHVRVETVGNQDQTEAEKWQWVNSTVRELDASVEHSQEKRANYNYTTTVKEIVEPKKEKIISKNLSSKDTVDTIITFEDGGRIIQSYMDDNWPADTDDSHILNVQVKNNTIPKWVDLRLGETVRKEKTTTTPH